MSSDIRDALERLGSDLQVDVPAREALERKARRVKARRVGAIAVGLIAALFAIGVPLMLLSDLRTDEEPAAGFGGYLAFIRDQSRSEDNPELWVMRSDGTDLREVPLPDRLMMLSDVAWSPDGRQLAFIATEEKNTEPTDLHVVNVDGSGLQRLTTGDLTLSPSWSPDGSELAFSRLTAGQTHLVVMDLETGKESPVPLPSDFIQFAHPVWSPDGSQLAFRANRGGIAGPYVVDIDGSGLHPIASDLHSGEPGVSSIDWSPDGSQFVIGYLGDIFVMAADGTGMREIARSPGLDTGASWSHDGRSIAFLTDRARPERVCMDAAGACYTMSDDLDIAIVDVEGGSVRVVTDGGGIGYSVIGDQPVAWA